MLVLDFNEPILLSVLIPSKPVEPLVPTIYLEFGFNTVNTVL